MIGKKDAAIIVGCLALLALFRDTSAIPFIIGYVIGISYIFDHFISSKKETTHDP